MGNFCNGGFATHDLGKGCIDFIGGMDHSFGRHSCTRDGIHIFASHRSGGQAHKLIGEVFFKHLRAETFGFAEHIATSIHSGDRARLIHRYDGFNGASKAFLACSATIATIFEHVNAHGDGYVIRCNFFGGFFHFFLHNDFARHVVGQVAHKVIVNRICTLDHCGRRHRRSRDGIHAFASNRSDRHANKLACEGFFLHLRTKTRRFGKVATACA